ncbi:MAG: hypothetical protein R8G66_20320 [Cytophagales bacterium]|nr:hypothetical protein [Cytophagales bacterium]
MEIELFGLILSEPVTAFGNLLLAMVCFYAFRQTKSLASTHGISAWSYFFLTLGASTFIGIFSHLFSSYDVQWLKLFGWVFAGLTAYFTQTASVEQVTKQKTGTGMWMVKVQLVLFFIALFWFRVFEVVLVTTVISLLTVLLLQAYGYWKKLVKGSELIIFGFVISVLTAVGRLMNLSIHPIWFNHHDVAHLLMIVACLVILAGVKRAAHSAL